jgi:16S rRNA (uracil1498-N3)-methyltransferase
MTASLRLRSLPRVLVSAPAFSPGARVALDPAAAAHARALRLRPGQALRVFDGAVGAASGEWLGTLSPGGAAVALERQLRPPPPARPAGGIALFAPPLERARMAFVVEKATELGAHAIVPLVAARAEHAAPPLGRAEEEAAEAPSGEEARLAAAVAAVALSRPRLRVPHSAMCAWARGAAEQSERLTLPLIGAPLRLAEALALVGDGRFFSADGLTPPLVLVADETLADGRAAPTVREAACAWREASGAAPGAGFVCVFIGPEGGWAQSEQGDFARLEGSGKLTRVSLGALVLRAETAAIAATAALADLGFGAK